MKTLEGEFWERKPDAGFDDEEQFDKTSFTLKFVKSKDPNPLNPQKLFNLPRMSYLETHKTILQLALIKGRNPSSERVMLKI